MNYFVSIEKKNGQRRSIAPVLAAVMAAAALFLWLGLAQASYADDGGVYKNIKWEYKTGPTPSLILEVQNTSSTLNHSLDFDVDSPAWVKYRNDIGVIQIKNQTNGIDSIGGSCFREYENLKSVSLGKQVDKITDYAFYGCENLDSVYHPTGNCQVQKVYDEDADDYVNKAFGGCDSSKLVFDVPEDSDLGMFARKNGFMIENSNGKFYSLMGAEVTNEEYYGSYVWSADDGYWAFTREKWTGKAIKPGAKAVVELYGKELEYGTDYTCSYSKNINVGEARVTIIGKGDYCDSIDASFVIYPKGTSITKVTGAKKKLTVKWLKQAKKMSKSHITGYQVQVATNKSFTKNRKTKTIRGYKKTSLTVKSLKAKKTYYVRVRTFKDIGLNEDLFSTWSPVKKVKVK